MAAQIYGSRKQACLTKGQKTEAEFKEFEPRLKFEG